jgi:hypothetical protein
MQDETTHTITSDTEIPSNIPPEAAPTERSLTADITELWAVHVQAQTVAKKTNGELKAIRQRLGESLYQMKQLLARPGRAGQWRSFLAARGIPRSNGDRYVREYSKSIAPTQSCSTEASFHEPTEAELGSLFAAIWPKLERRLTTSRARYDFVRCIAFRSGLKYDWQDNGLFIYEPGHERQVPESTTATPRRMVSRMITGTSCDGR